MWILNRYIFQEFLSPFLSGTLFFTLLFAIPNLRGLVGLMIEKSVPPLLVLELFLYMIPVTASITIPMGTLFGTLFCLGRLSQDSEIIAMRANGISLFKIFKPVVVIGLITALGLFFFMNYIFTETSVRYRSIFANVIYANPSIIMSSKQFSNFSENSQKITAVEIDEEGNMYSVYLYERSKDNNEIKVVYAEEGIWINNQFNSEEMALKLYDGELVRFDEQNLFALERVRFDQMVFNIVKETRSIDLIERGLREQNIFEIGDLIVNTLANGEEVDPSIYVEYHRKISIPTACLAFVIMAIPLAVSFQRSGKGIGLGMSLIVILAYYLLLSTSEAIGKSNVVDPSVSMHIPNIIFVSIGMVLFLLKTKK